MIEIPAPPLDAEAFAPFGEVLEAAGPPDALINDGTCGRWHDRARLDVAAGRPGISLFRAEPRALPLTVAAVERHPLYAQAFLPMGCAEWLVLVAPDEGGAPGRPLAFRASGAQGVNIGRGVWHGVLTPLAAPGLFAVVDRIAADESVEVRPLDPPVTVVAPD